MKSVTVDKRVRVNRLELANSKFLQNWGQIQGKSNLVRVGGGSGVIGFELVGFYCIP